MVSKFRCLFVCEFRERDLDGLRAARYEGEGITAGFIDIDKDDRAVWWDVTQKIQGLRGPKKIQEPRYGADFFKDFRPFASKADMNAGFIF